MENYLLHRTPVKKETLSPGSLSDDHFWLLINISSIHSKKVIDALRDFLVLGYTRKESCIHHGVSQSYFSTSLSRLQHVNSMMYQLVPYYS
ncbi:adhesin biosynthesis transcription regulatory family protein [Escherichia albertii]|uniref:adhesin biosynthesis transcription regulatory family protein n=1 Tax=Escherichia albertii TaxID=208962 RepID=UPI0007442EF1|nr:adhesin biosynthesis transcription regulatory family protein [Escherichia albertii]EGM8070156.1 transcriptional regulator [Escherichia albertii]MCU7267288.1 adhesin biosynthesis transcription regulatory family protein [Escherichia albertii]MCU7285675.1 adhesin biosynthesis transcription regulatory family protein [Escherichia albertii]MCU7323186.1 adhesin biosynthesis transcription regulatory family protein [Escherichia albertii]WDC14453.1 adhesin biosynthesis transcription regulatory family